MKQTMRLADQPGIPVNGLWAAMKRQGGGFNRPARLLAQAKFFCRRSRRSSLVAPVVILAILFQFVFAPFAGAGVKESRTVRRLRTQAKGAPTSSFNSAIKTQDFTPQAVTVEAVIVRHAPSLNSGRVEGSIRQLSGEATTLNSGAVVTSNLLVPGTPQVQINGTVSFGGTVQGTGSAQPSGYPLTLNSSVTLGHLVTRTDPVAMPTVSAPPTPTGTRNVTLNSPGQGIGDPATLRNLTLNSNVGTVSVPPGTYGAFTVNSGSGLTLGVANSTQPAVYNLQSLTLNSGSQVQLAGPVVLTVNTGMNLNAVLGSSANPLWLRLNIASGGLTLNSGSSFYGVVQAPAGTVTVNGNTLLQGAATCDRFTLNGGGQLKGSAGAVDSLSPTRATQGQSLTVTLKGNNTHWVAGNTKASFGGEIAVGGAAPGDFGPVQVVDANTATAQIDVSATAALAPRTVQIATTVFAPDEVETETLIDGFTVVSATPPGAASATVTTVAGLAGAPGFADGTATAARFRDLAGIAVGADDTIYVADAGNHRIRKIAANGTVSTLAGNGTAGFADGAGGAAQFNNPQGVAVDANGVVYVADTGNHRIRRIATDGTVSTLAGDGTAGLVNGAAAQARFNAPRGLAVDAAGNVYVADSGNSAVRVISGGNVNTVAGDGTVGASDSPARFNGLSGVAVDGTTLYIYAADTGNHRIRRLTPGGVVITIAGAERGFADGSGAGARFADPSGIAVDGAGKLVVADATNSLVRLVDAELALGGSSVAVTTAAGTGERGASDGAGNVARFITPRGVAVSPSSAILVADSGNSTVRRILLPPLVASFNPAQAHAGDSVTINGERFDGRSPAGNVVTFTKVGGGQTVAVVSAATRTQLTVVVPADAATGPVSVQTQGGIAASATNFVVLPPAPAISDFNPKHGAIGSSVTLTGSNLQVAGGPTSVTFAGSGGNRLQALVTSLTATQAVVTVPNAAITGPIELTTAGGTAATAHPFTVDVDGYQLTVSPSLASAVQHTGATYVVTVTSSTTTFSQLASLTATDLPAGVEASFSPAQITAGASSTLTVNLANADLAAGSYGFTIRAEALVEGSPLVRTAAATLSVMAAGQTTLSGRVMSGDDLPILGATVSLDGRTATTDAAGNFLLSGVGAGVNRALMIDGRTASAPNRTYPVILEPATVVSGQANVVAYTFYLPAIDTQYEVEVVPGQATVATNPRVPGLQMTIPAGANLRNRDGSPVARVSITPVAIDRTPAPLPADVGTTLVFTSQPGGAVSDVAMPVVYPNLAGANPDTRVDLYAFNHDTVSWYVYGYGKVSADGRTIVPEIDPATGKQYGLRDFSWHFANVSTPGNTSPGDDCPTSYTGNPVDLATGVKVESMTDVAFGGARGGVQLTRIYTGDLASVCTNCAFGKGWTHNYDVRLTGTFDVGGAGRVVMPGQVSGRLFSYVGTEGDGTLDFGTTATVSQLGDLVRKFTDGTYEYRYKSGEVMRFDANGRLVGLVDRNGNTTGLTYTGANLTRITDAVGRSVVLDYDGEGRIIKATDPLGREWGYGYEVPAGGLSGPVLATVTDPLSQVMRYVYTPAGALQEVIDRRGNVVKLITYDDGGRVGQQEFADGGVERYEYSLSGTVITGVKVTDPLGRVTTKRFNASGYVTEETDGLGQASRMERDLTTNLAASVTGPCGCLEQQQQFDGRGNITSRKDRLGQTEQFEYDPVFNNVTRRIDQLGRSTNYGYDTHGNLISISDALNQVTSFTYDSFGQQTEVTNPLGHIWHYEYNGNGDMIERIAPLEKSTTMEYDAVGRLKSVLDPLSRRTSMIYDELDRVVSITSPAGGVTQLIYDANGNKIGMIDALGQQWVSVYDLKNRLISQTDPLGHGIRREYDMDNDLISIITPSGRALHYTYDTRGQRLTRIDPLAGTVRYAYDSRGNLSVLIDPRGSSTTFTYDELFRLTATRDPLGQTTTVEYDAADEMSATVDRLGHRASMTYDILGRLDKVTYTDAVVRYFYDAASHLTRLDDSQYGSVQWTYDDAERMLSETTPAGTVTYQYNNADQRILMMAADLQPVSYGYDSAGRLQTITQGTDVFTYDYDILSRRVGLRRPNGLDTAYQYDSANRLTRLTHTNRQGTNLEDYQYSYSGDEEVASISSLFSDPPLPPDMAISPADAANRIMHVGASDFNYNAEGQVTSKTVAGDSTEFEWDSRGRLTRVILPDGQNVSYTYDPLGRCVGRSTREMTTTFLYDLGEIVSDRGSNGSRLDYINGIGIDQKLRQSSSSTGIAYFVQDHLGSITALTDATGNATGRVSYGVFGDSTGKLLTRYGYTGREQDDLTGFLYYRSRWYDPKQGRFLSEDPSGFSAGLNFYSYVGNDPILYKDPSGQKRCGPNATDWLIDQISTNSTNPAIAEAASFAGPRILKNPMYLNFLRNSQFRQLVRANGDWDFKSLNHPYGKALRGDSPRCLRNICPETVTLCGKCFNYDVVGNIHFGAVGRAAGIPDDVLHAGADYAQAGGLWNYTVKGIRDEDPDFAAIDIGQKVFDNPNSLCSVIKSLGPGTFLNRASTEGCDPWNRAFKP